jgi:hypothetical protein
VKFNSSDKDHLPKAFNAIKWLIGKANEWRNETDNTEWGTVQVSDRSFSGSIPWHMHDELIKLAHAGYCHPKEKTIGNLHWFSGTQEHRIHWNFGKTKSTQYCIQFYHSIYDYTDGLPAGIQDAS